MTASARFASLALAALVAAGCSSSSGGTGNNTANTTPPTITPTTSSSPSRTPSKSPKPTPSFSSTVSATQPCTTPHLSLTLGQGQGAAGSTILPLVFTNVGHKPCTLYGYPGVSFLDSNEKQIGVDAARTGGNKAIVTLGPGDQANAQLQVPEPGNFSSADCRQATAAFILVYPPDQKTTIETNTNLPVCTTEAGRSSVRPLTPGSGG
ncbi:MAG TPA: DUF4232 domain-containing protein [Mycobacteriales bacterium]|nr:DUF4232 domain-containing protein [Mycobacteriales bacterium]